MWVPEHKHLVAQDDLRAVVVVAASLLPLCVAPAASVARTIAVVSGDSDQL